ncbi:MAG: 2-phosphoglycerate kinase [Candidatus Heimdallarchaeota archaeon LC_2]|nr:MAG: 2-phosphoglycerate kinase [Candidatus Heimdallarchaeota archaeon LC_2]
MSSTDDEIKVETKSFITVEGSGYKYRFSRGLLAHSLQLRGLPLDEAYRVAKKVQTVLKSKGIETIKEDDLREYVKTLAVHFFGEEIATNYNLIEKWHGSSVPIIILISGAKGTGTAKIGELIAQKLAIPTIVSTSIVAKILRKMISPELAPELHAKSYLAFEKLRPIYSILYDKVLVGYEEHSRFVAEAVEALVKRALDEGISMVVRGEHLLPRFMSSEFIKHPNVIYVTLRTKDEERHRSRYCGYFEIERMKEKQGNFPEIRKIHDYLIEEAKNRKLTIIDSDNTQDTIIKLNELILERIEMIFSENGENTTPLIDFDISDIHS